MHQILILGNGFDLSCGLKSSYSDFFEDRYCNLNSILCKNTDKVSFKEIDFINLTYPIMEQNVDPICKLKEVLHINDLTFWDLIFLIAKDCVDLQIDAYKWQDVETVIFDVISISLGFEEDCKMP
ncbi:MAG: AbiH family protein, partial [Lactobacillus sp.]|nr:AbiH family protein [Lactobacillus sp.]